LASRLHAFDLAISAWHKAEGVHHEP
jgi:hypothetical protein